MKLGVLRDIKANEYRVVLTPQEVATIVGDGHPVYVQAGAGVKAGFSDAAYEKAGARLLETAAEMYAEADFLVKVKEFEESEYDLLRKGQIYLTCIHPAAHPAEVEALLRSECIAFTAEDTHRYGSPNCEAAGKQGALFGLHHLLSTNGGKGKFVGGLAGAPGIQAVILGAGLVGKAALQVLEALGAWVTVLDINIATLRDINRQYGDRVHTMLSTKENIAALLPTTDLVLNCVKWPKESKTHLIDRGMLKLMEPGSVIVDISADEGGAVETYKETTHADPTYVIDGVIHFGVSNIPASIAKSASQAYAVSLVGHIRSILNNGVAEACRRDGFLRRALTVYQGVLTHEETSALQQRPWRTPADVLGLDPQTCDPAPPATGTRSPELLQTKGG